jgi:hypothetical protein
MLRRSEKGSEMENRKDNTRAWILIIALMLLSYLIVSLQVANSSPMDYVNSFYEDTYRRNINVPVKYIQIEIADLPNANGKIMRKGTHLLIVIDASFYEYYKDKSQLKRLVYYLLGYELMGHSVVKHGNHVMNWDRVYFPLKQKHIEKLFAYEKA